MAIIECRVCGKRISDTTETCIHCGAPVKQEAEKEAITATAVDTVLASSTAAVETEKKEEQKTELKFFSFDIEKQVAMEEEFLKSDARAMKYKRGVLQTPKYISLCGTFFLIAMAIVLGTRYLYQKVFDKQIYNEQLFMYGAVIDIAMIALCGVLAVTFYIRGFIQKRSIKRFVYQKKFQNWLAEEKGIAYYPVFMNANEKAVFDQLDLKVIDL